MLFAAVRGVNSCTGADSGDKQAVTEGGAPEGRGARHPLPEQVPPCPPAPLSSFLPLPLARLPLTHSRVLFCVVLGRALRHVTAYFPDQGLNRAPAAGAWGLRDGTTEECPPHFGISAPLVPTPLLHHPAAGPTTSRQGIRAFLLASFPNEGPSSSSSSSAQPRVSPSDAVQGAVQKAG